MPRDDKTPDELQAAYSGRKASIQRLIAHVGKLESEVEEHKLVIDTLKGYNPGKKCFRLVHGVLIEKTAGEVLPLLEVVHENLLRSIEAAMVQYKSEDTAFKQFIKENNIRVMS